MSIKDYLQAYESVVVVVFGLLVGLVIIIKMISFVLSMSKNNQAPTAASEEPICGDLAEQDDTGISAGQLKLIGVDEKTAAMIMAIVSDESKIPLSELQFMSIKSLD